MNTHVWDAESRLKITAGSTYLYDSDGRRVKKSSGTIYWFDTRCDALDEIDAAGNTNYSSFFEYVFFGGARIARRSV